MSDGHSGIVMSMPVKYAMSVGDRAPPCIGITAKGSVYSFEEQAGRTVVIILAKNLNAPGLVPLLASFSAQADEFHLHETDLIALIAEDVERVFEFNFRHPSRVTLVGALNDFLERNKINKTLPDVLAGSPDEFMEQIGFDSAEPEVLILDRNLRVAGRIGTGDPENRCATAMMIVKALPTETPRDICAPAPVLILPNLLDLDLCRELVELHQSGQTSDSPAFSPDAAGQMRHKLDYGLKKRRDFLLEREHPMHIQISDILQRRCIPEIKRAFQADVSHTDRINVACYPGNGGHFRRHRDNRPDIVAYRKFALSINLTLSADGYEGGYLRLPEFNGHRYRCPPGAGVIFSVALLHEITPVLSGNRYVLITHLHDDEGEVKWQQMRETLVKMDMAM